MYKIGFLPQINRANSNRGALNSDRDRSVFTLGRFGSSGSLAEGQGSFEWGHMSLERDLRRGPRELSRPGAKGPP